jgi:hypothetical protein
VRGWTALVLQIVVMIRGQVRAVVGFVAVVTVLVTAPWVSDQLDHHGLPGGAMVLGLLVALAGYCVWIVVGMGPDRRRRRAFARFAAERGVPFRSWFHLPDSLHAIDGLADASTDLVRNRVIVGDPPVFVFDRCEWSEPYEPLRCFTFAAIETDLDLPPVVVNRRGLTRPTSGADLMRRPLVGSETELDTFNRRYQVHTGNGRAAAAFVDPRLMAWLLDLEEEWTFEAAGRWVTCSAPELSTRRFDDLVAALTDFHSHIPRVVGSLYPARDPGMTRPPHPPQLGAAPTDTP